MKRRVHAEPIIVIPEDEEFENPNEPVAIVQRRERVAFERFVVAMRDQNELAEMDDRDQVDDEENDNNDINNRLVPVVNGWDMPELVDDDNDHDIDVNNINNYRNLHPGVADERFWKIIESFNWRNRTDGVISKRDLERPIRNLTRLDEQIFREKLKEYYTMLHEKLTHDGMFGNVTPNEQSKTVSHMIALGLQIYNTVLEDATFVYILVEQGDCQSLIDLLPANLKIDVN